MPHRPEIIVDNELVPRSLGESRRPHVESWTPTQRRIGQIPSILSAGETAIHRPQILDTIKFPLIERPTPILDFLRGFQGK